MPSVDKPETTMALLPQPGASSPSNETRQPRQPTSLQGLMRFTMEATKAEDVPKESEFTPMDEERRTFLENALKSMTVGVVELLQKQIEILKKVENLTSQTIEEYTNAIGTILEYVDDIDTANDFHKIGGFMILNPCLRCSHPDIKAGGCELIAVLCQNNAYCQRVVLDNEFVPILLNVIENDENVHVAVKALYALSGIIRDNDEGFNQLKHYKGLAVLLSTIKRSNEKLITKATFTLSSLCRRYPTLKGELISLGYVPCLISLISSERSLSREHVLSLLVTIIEDQQEAVEECRSTKYNLKDVLQRLMNSVKNKEECKEEEEYCKRLLHLLHS